jgi:ABC-type multidrug transport system ATPase subunit
MHRNFKGESTYLAELDAHFPELTLGETLAFAAKTTETAAAVGDSNAQPNGDRLSGSSIMSREVASLFDLDKAYSTPVGNAMIRGISGGEKRRTSIAEVFIGSAQFQFWDNSTRGLDSSTALRFIQTQRQVTTSLRTTVVMSLYQASEAMYEVCQMPSVSRRQTLSPGSI